VSSNPAFPLTGVIGVVAESASELDLATDKGLQCVEIRADLLLDQGLTEADIFDLIKAGKQKSLGVLFTLRHPTHGGTFQGTEYERVKLSLEAVRVGADLFDLEFGSEAVSLLPEDTPPGILSYHDFKGMPTAVELQHLTEKMERSGARAIKVVPTASRLEDALTMLKWVGQQNNSISRIGFAMGEAGACSRILTTLLGGEITYASFGAPVAPGQIDIDEMLTQYRISKDSRNNTVTAVCIEGDAGMSTVHELNSAGDGSIAVAFSASAKDILEDCAQWMKITKMLS